MMGRTVAGGAELIGPVGVRRFELGRKCQMHVGHTHNFDHSTVVISGALKVIYTEPDGTKIESEVFYPGQWVFIAAERPHTIKAMEDGTAYQCVFSHRDFDGLVTQEYKGNVTAYV